MGLIPQSQLVADSCSNPECVPLSGCGSLGRLGQAEKSWGVWEVGGVGTGEVGEGERPFSSVISLAPGVTGVDIEVYTSFPNATWKFRMHFAQYKPFSLRI